MISALHFFLILFAWSSAFLNFLMFSTVNPTIPHRRLALTKNEWKTAWRRTNAQVRCMSTHNLWPTTSGLWSDPATIPQIMCVSESRSDATFPLLQLKTDDQNIYSPDWPEHPSNSIAATWQPITIMPVSFCVIELFVNVNGLQRWKCSTNKGQKRF